MDKTGLVIVLLLALLPHSLGVSRKYQYVNLLMTWTDAQSYCRENFADLATIETVDDWASVRNLIPSTDIAALIGLYNNNLKGWKWSDHSKASLRMWSAGEPNGGTRELCAVSSVQGWHDIACDRKFPFICSVPITRLLKVELKSDGSVDLNDPSVQETLLNQMKKHMGDHGIDQLFRLRWRKEPNGNIFSLKTG
ncbi:lactose-binding lectin l-2-like [Perca flavescens]|uniref:lactose-binding lectin l-2-like n=1 Tax=Perca flavescens TaxID=8167 RepID=UPI00106E9484|nr:lactose-binding lectin l-2-like [Perca flavescens]